MLTVKLWKASTPCHGCGARRGKGLVIIACHGTARDNKLAPVLCVECCDGVGIVARKVRRAAKRKRGGR